MGRDMNPRKSLGSLHGRIKEARVLMVGAGGIGCELLKNLVLTGFGEIHIVDLDTIDLSNLNRQFLFGMQHIKKSKAIVAKETAGRFNPNVKLEAHHANIKDNNFNVKWFKTFDVVFNALDNLDARRHVNKMCLAADVPLIESGTTGFNGQVQVIKQRTTECYDCTHKPIPKSFPVCTIRSTPSQPIHCIVWAKSYLFVEIFGTSEESSPEVDPSENDENAKEIANLKREAEELKNIREKMDSPDFAATIFGKVFAADIDRLRSMEDMWKSRKPPEALNYSQIYKEAVTIDNSIAKNDQKVWTLAENYVVFADSLQRLAKRMLESKASVKDGEAVPILAFDKDDEDTLDFVAASANLRSLIFGIDSKSKFDIKQMAGNIIPAIATTNAITAGLCVLQAFKVLREDYKTARMVFLSRSADRAFSSEKLSPPNPNCEVCSVARITIEADVSRATIGDLVNKVLREQLGYGEELSVLTKELLYDADYDDNKDTPLSEIGFGEETFVTIVDDDEEEPRINLVLVVTNTTLPDNDEPILVPEKFEIPRKPKAMLVGNGDGMNCLANGVKRSHEDLVLAAGEVANGNVNEPEQKKRKVDVIVENRDVNVKRAKVFEEKKDDDIIILDDDGFITIE